MASAGPIAGVALNLLGALQGFPEVFFAKIVQRVGGWPVPLVNLPINDIQDPEERMKLRGFRKGDNGGWETADERMQRVSGIMRVYFEVLKRKTENENAKMFHTTRYWTWFARILGERMAWEEAVTAELIYGTFLACFGCRIIRLNDHIVALDVMGAEAIKLWGRQFVKVLEMIYLGVKQGYAPGKYLGGISTEGKAARVRVELEIDKIMK